MQVERRRPWSRRHHHRRRCLGGTAAVELPSEGIRPVAEITTGGLERLQTAASGVANQTGVPATTTPRASCQAIVVPSAESETSLASPWVGRSHPLSSSRTPPSALTGNIAMPRWPPDSASTARTLPFALTSARCSPVAFNQGVNSFEYGGWPAAFWTMTWLPLRATRRLPESVPDSAPSRSKGSRYQLLEPSA